MERMSLLARDGFVAQSFCLGSQKWTSLEDNNLAINNQHSFISSRCSSSNNAFPLQAASRLQSTTRPTSIGKAKNNKNRYKDHSQK